MTANIQATWGIIAGFAGMFVVIMGGMLHTVWRLGAMEQKVDSLADDVKDLRDHVFPKPYRRDQEAL
jgi:uncharacterized ion transporter superfamily protein YfcC